MVFACGLMSTTEKVVRSIVLQEKLHYLASNLLQILTKFQLKLTDAGRIGAAIASLGLG